MLLLLLFLVSVCSFGVTHMAYSVNSNDCIFQKHDMYVVGKIMVGMVKAIFLESIFSIWFLNVMINKASVDQNTTILSLHCLRN